MRAILLVCAAAGIASAEPCPKMATYPHALTADNAAIVDGGGIVVGALPERDDGKADPRGTVADWRFDKQPAKVTHVAPGLDVVAAPGAGTLTSKDGDAQVTVAHAAGAAPILAAPAVTKLERAARDGTVIATATLAADPPATALAIVVLDRDGKTGRSWNTIAAHDRAPHVYVTGGCAPMPPGTVDSRAGDDVVLAWLDTSGRLSKLSAAVHVKSSSP